MAWHCRGPLTLAWERTLNLCAVNARSVVHYYTPEKPLGLTSMYTSSTREFAPRLVSKDDNYFRKNCRVPVLPRIQTSLEPSALLSPPFPLLAPLPSLSAYPYPSYFTSCTPSPPPTFFPPTLEDEKEGRSRACPAHSSPLLFSFSLHFPRRLLTPTLLKFINP